MSYTIGLDFGTHQTKICIEDASNPAQKTYEFFEFELNGKTTLFLPSIIQINRDYTIQYGSLDEENCKTSIKEPELPILPVAEPLILPNKPIEPELTFKYEKANLLESRIKLEKDKKLRRSLNKERQIIKREVESKLHDYKKELTKWKKIHLANQSIINENQVKCEEIRTDYQQEYSRWKNSPGTFLQYRYFKQACFTEDYNWNSEISPDILSTWYIAFVILNLQKRLGENIFIQMGVPSGSDKRILDKQKKKAFSILISAYKLTEEYKNLENYLSINYHELLNKTHVNYNFTDEDLYFYGLDVLPEAYAGLISVTNQRRLESGMNLLVDIGGGTTDVAFFTINEDQPDIHLIDSFAKGLNFIFDEYIKKYPELQRHEIQSLFGEDKGEKHNFLEAINTYRKELRYNTNNIVQVVTKSFEELKNTHRIDTKRLYDALQNRPVIYCGGGATFSNIKIPLDYFNDLKTVNKGLLNINSVVNKNLRNEDFTILSTAFGLSIPLEKQIEMTPIENVFDHLKTDKDDEWSRFNYEHGLTE